ncbi:MAG: hypothetical protein VB878_00040 [Pirellulaceae bacterium]
MSKSFASAKRIFAIGFTAITISVLAWSPCNTHAAPVDKSEKAVEEQPFAVYSRTCSRSPWRITSHENARHAFWAASLLREKSVGNVFVMTGKQPERWIQHPQIGNDTTLKSCSVYRVYCKSSEQIATTTNAKDARLLAEAIKTEGGESEIVYHYSDK